MQYGDFAALYDALMKDVDYGAWSEYVQTLISAHTSGNIIAECACGTGSLTIPLARAGYSVTGIDISGEMLRVAAEKARNAGLFIPLVQMDMKNLTLHKPVDAVVCACDGVNYLTSENDLSLFFGRAYASLKSGGVLLFDISSEYKLSHILGINTFFSDDALCTYTWRNMYDEKSRLLEMNLTFFTPCGGGRYTRFDERHIQAAHSVEKIKTALEAAGFCDISAYEHMTKKPPSDTTERIQFAAKKP